MSRDIQRRAPLRGAKFHYALRLQMVNNLVQYNQLLGQNTKDPWERVKHFTGARKVNFRKDLIDIPPGNLEVFPPGQRVP